MKNCKRLLIRIYGIVQGVGFRPFVSRAADSCYITGSVCNKGSYVEVIADGTKENLDNFIDILKNDPPERSSILKMDISEEGEAGDGTTFDIIESSHRKGEIFVSPDIATCPKCKAELFDKNNRRYLHPFINCTACGPRLTILDSMPYDRERTSMSEFPMCPECAYEYTHAETRRYDAQPVCCNDCGPELYIIGRDERGADALRYTRKVISRGGIVAIKGIGGFHLCCDAADSEAVARLRRLKHRPVKPFAVMMRDLDTVRRECFTEPGEENILDGHQKPIILLKRRAGGKISPDVAPGNPKVGVMLPYAPVQMLLFSYPDDTEMTDCFVMTSGNVSGAPICRSDEDAAAEISGMCDMILSNDRKIRIRADDSVMDFFRGKPYMIRRSRGYAPLPFMLSKGYRGRVLAVGGELKNTFCIGNNDLFYPSPYVGDMGDIRTVEALRETVRRMEELLETEPQVVACDMHPRYNTAQFARELGLPVVEVQHHYAHIVSCMAENDFDGEVIGVSFDGVGYGTDGTIWGGEFLRATYKGFTRIGCISPFQQAGGDISSIEGWRTAVSLLYDLCGRSKEKTVELAASLGLCDGKNLAAQFMMLDRGINCVKSTSMGRLFDAVSAILGIKKASTFEGEASMSLEFAADENAEYGDVPQISKDGELFVVDTKAVIGRMVRGMDEGKSVSALAGEFHDAAAHMVYEGCRAAREATGIPVVALSGGVFQNQLLLKKCCKLLEGDGFAVIRHSLVPPNDGGIALGQAVAAMEILNKDRKITEVRTCA